MKFIPAPLVAALLGLGLPFAGQAQDKQEKATAEGEGPAAAATAAAQRPTLLKPEELKWNRDLKWISFIVDDGRAQSQRDYFGAVTSADFQTLLAGTGTTMIKVQQVFYVQQPDSAIFPLRCIWHSRCRRLLQAGVVHRIVELNQKFVESLAVRGFLNVAGE